MIDSIAPRNTNADNQHAPDISQHIQDLAQRVLDGQLLDRDQLMSLTTLRGPAVYELFHWANKIRIKFVGRDVKLCSIAAGKVGACSEDCAYCSQSAHYKTHVTPSKLTVEQMQAATEEALANGASSFGIVNSGRGPTDRELDWLEPYYRQAAEKGDIRPCATLGELTPEKAQRLADMGVQRINHNLETSQRHFPNVITTHTYQDRVNTIRNAKAAGLSICSGGIFGLGETWQDRIDMALALRDLEVDVTPINFLNAIHGTPMHGKVDKLDALEALQIIAVYRFAMPHGELKVAGGRETVLRDMQSWIFYAGASSFMVGNYLTTFGRGAAEDHQMLRDLGLSYVGYDETTRPAAEYIQRSAEASAEARKRAGTPMMRNQSEPAADQAPASCCTAQPAEQPAVVTLRVDAQSR